MKSSSDVVMRTGRLRVSSGTLFWHEAGRGDTLIFLHGSWHDSGQWLPVMQALAPEYHCLAPDLIGFGESTSTAKAHSVDLEVEALHSLLQALRTPHCVMVGHSLGAWVALRYAQRYPDQVRGVAVVAPEGLIDPQGSRWRLDRWLASSLSPLGPLITLASWLGWRGKLKTLRRRRHTLRRTPVACQILFRRRPADIAAERIDPTHLSLPVVQFVTTDPSPLPTPWGQVQRLPAAETPLGVGEADTIAALGQFLVTTLLTPTV